MILQELFRENEEVITLSPQARMSDAAELMRRESIGSIVIVDETEIVGIITDRDIGLSLALTAATPDSFVNEVMSRDVETIYDSMTLFEAARCFKKAHVKRLPVVNQNKQLVGIVSTDDVIAMLSRELHDTCTTLEYKHEHLV